MEQNKMVFEDTIQFQVDKLQILHRVEVGLFSENVCAVYHPPVDLCLPVPRLLGGNGGSNASYLLTYPRDALASSSLQILGL